MRSAIESAWPRTIAASAAVSLRGGSGSRALPPIMPGRSAAKVTSSSGWRAIARRQPVTARLNGSVGASFVGVFALMLVDITMPWSSQCLGHPEAPMTGGKLVEPRELAIAELGVELRRLEAEGVEIHIA